MLEGWVQGRTKCVRFTAKMEANAALAEATPILPLPR